MVSAAAPKKKIHPPALMVLVVSLMMLMNGLGCLLIGPLFGLAAPGLGVAAWYEAQRHADLDERGITCPGEVVNAAEYYNSDGHRQVRVTYEYQCGTGTYSADFTESYNDDWPPGTPLNIEALPEDPDDHRRQGETSDAPAMVAVGGFIGVIGACACSLVALLFGLVVWSARNLYRAVEE